MANNLHISYDLYAPGQNYETVIAKIKSLGTTVKIHKSYWYVQSNYTASQACDAIWKVMDRNDSLYVVDAKTNAAAWQNLAAGVGESIKRLWQ